jgi:hypothetical protein
MPKSHRKTLMFGAANGSAFLLSRTRRGRVDKGSPVRAKTLANRSVVELR